MKTIHLITILLTSLLLGACEKPSPETPEVVIPSMFDLQWATRIDFEKEIVGTDNTQHYKDWMLVGGDLDFPPTIMAFNKATGVKEWEYVHEGVVKDHIVSSTIYDNIYIGMGAKGVIGVNIDNLSPLWEIDLRALNMTQGSELIEFGDKLYFTSSKALNTLYETHNIIELDPLNGIISTVFSSDGPSSSPPTFWEDSEANRILMVFNYYPNNFDPPEDQTQGIMAVDLVSGETIWETMPFTENFSSNVLHPPVIYEDIVITGGDWSIYAFDINTGEQLWRYAFDYTTSVFGKTNHLVHDGRLYVNNSQFDVTCLDPRTGALIWNNSEGGPNSTDNMVYYEKEDWLVFTSWGYGSVMVLDALTGKTLHREHRYDNSSYNNDVVYDEARDMFFTSTYKHAVGFKLRRGD